MNDPNARPYRAPWLAVYVVLGASVLGNLLRTAYCSARDVRQLYPHFSFQELLVEELAMHQTWLPLLRVHVSTLHLLGAYAAALAAKQWGVLPRGGALVADLFSGRWLCCPLFETVFALLPFAGAEPDVPELISDDEASAIDADGGDGVGADIAPCPVDVDACNRALAKLVQVKLQHADQTIPRPDDWLVFDPVQEKLVLQKDTACVKDASSLSSSSLSKHSHSSGSKVDLLREQASWRQ